MFLEIFHYLNAQINECGINLQFNCKNNPWSKIYYETLIINICIELSLGYGTCVYH